MKTKSPHYRALDKIIKESTQAGYDLGSDLGWDKGYAHGVDEGRKAEREYIFSIDNTNPN